jgi:hypothetical protein
VQHPNAALVAEVAYTLPQVFGDRNRELQLGRVSESKANLEKELINTEADLARTQTTPFERLSQLADVVVFDSPPLLAVTDAAVMGRQVDGVVLVIDARQTREMALARAVSELQFLLLLLLLLFLGRGRRSA